MKLSKIFLLLLTLIMVSDAATERRYYIRRSNTATSSILTWRVNSRASELRKVYFKCSVACTWTVSKNGTVTGGTDSTIQKLDDRAPIAASTLILDGTVSGDTVVNSDSLAADSSASLAGGLYLPVPRTGVSYMHFKLTGSSGTMLIYAEVDEP